MDCDYSETIHELSLEILRNHKDLNKIASIGQQVHNIGNFGGMQSLFYGMMMQFKETDDGIYAWKIFRVSLNREFNGIGNWVK